MQGSRPIVPLFFWSWSPRSSDCQLSSQLNPISRLRPQLKLSVTSCVMLLTKQTFRSISVIVLHPDSVTAQHKGNIMPAGVHFAAMHHNCTEAMQSILVLKFMGCKDSSPPRAHSTMLRTTEPTPRRCPGMKGKRSACNTTTCMALSTWSAMMRPCIPAHAAITHAECCVAWDFSKLVSPCVCTTAWEPKDAIDIHILI